MQAKFLGLLPVMLLLSLLGVALLARPVLLSVTASFLYPGLSTLANIRGVGGLTGLLALTLLGTWEPLKWGAVRLEGLEQRGGSDTDSEKFRNLTEFSRAERG